MLTIRSATALAVLATVAPLVTTAAAQVTPVRGDSLRRDSAAVASPATAGVRRDSTLVPRADQPRGVDAELRAALFDIIGGRPLQALNRLDFLTTSPVIVAGSGAPNVLLAREDMLFLLAQAQYRLGMADAFRTTAQQLVSSSSASRYGGILRVQLMLDAYRRGDYQQVVAMSDGVSSWGGRGLASLVAGLASYSAKNYPTARTTFDAAAQAGGEFSGYARYMSALATVAADTAKGAAAGIEALRAAAGSAPGEFADQVNLAAAQLAYQRGQFDAAGTLAGNVSADGGLAAQALFARGWALYKANQLDASAAAFRDFGTRYPHLPERDEARLMAGQVLLQSGRAGEASPYFQQVADSIVAEAGALQARAGSAMTEAARSLVAARAAGLLFLNDPATGKTLALPEAVGSDVASLAAALGSPVPAGASADSLRAELVSLADVETRMGTLTPPLGADFPRRLVFLTGGDPASRAGYVQRSQALRVADVSTRMAQARLQEATDAQAAKIALLSRLQVLLGEEGARLNEVAARLTAVRDSLTRLAGTVNATRTRLRDLMRGQAEATRLMATENAARLDSLRGALGGVLRPEDVTALGSERETSVIYRQMSEAIAGNIDGAFARHPVVLLQDSVRGRAERIQGLIAETQSAIASSSQSVNDELARLRAGDTERVRTLRASLAAAETGQRAAETQLVAAVEAELRARATRMLSVLRHDAEAAEFGSATAAFFSAVDGVAGATRTSGTGASAGGTAAGTEGGVPAKLAAPATSSTRPPGGTTSPR
ncbi:MAG: hypothetical protein WKG32_07780 [Gemmatimonadaceae bacterium]